MNEIEFQVTLTNHYRGFTIKQVETVKNFKFFADNPNCSHQVIGRNLKEIIQLIDEIYDGKRPHVIFNDRT